MVSRRKLLQVGTVGMASLSMPHIVKAQEDPIRIGDISSDTAQMSTFTKPYRKGRDLALNEINDAGGINGRELTVISVNDHGSADTAGGLARQLIERERVTLLTGTFLSDAGLAVSEMAARYKTLFIAANPLTDRLTMEDGNRYTFRVRPNTYMQAKMLAQQASKLPVTRWACVGPDYEFGHSAVSNFQDILEQMRPDIEWVSNQWVPLFNSNPEKILAGWEGKNIQAVFNATFASDLRKLADLAQSRNALDDIAVYSLLTGEPEYTDHLTPGSCDGWTVTGYPWDQIETTSHRKFVKRYRDYFDEDPKLGALVGYITYQAVIALLQQSSLYETEEMIDRMERLFFNSPLGTIRFRAIDHQSSMGAFVGRMTYQNRTHHMTDWFYADGSEFWPNEDEVNFRKGNF